MIMKEGLRPFQTPTSFKRKLPDKTCKQAWEIIIIFPKIIMEMIWDFQRKHDMKRPILLMGTLQRNVQNYKIIVYIH